MSSKIISHELVSGSMFNDYKTNEKFWNEFRMKQLEAKLSFKNKKPRSRGWYHSDRGFFYASFLLRRESLLSHKKIFAPAPLKF